MCIALEPDAFWYLLLVDWLLKRRVLLQMIDYFIFYLQIFTPFENLSSFLYQLRNNKLNFTWQQSIDSNFDCIPATWWDQMVEIHIPFNIIETFFQL